MAVKERSSYIDQLYGLKGGDYAYESSNACFSYHNVPEANLGYYQGHQSRIDTTFIGEPQRQQLPAQNRHFYARPSYSHYPQTFVNPIAASHYVPTGPIHPQRQSIHSTSGHPWRTRMFDAQEDSSMHGWKPSSSEAFGQGMNEWNCPGLVDGTEDHYSPSTAFCSPISPASSVHEDAKGFFTDSYGGKYSSPAFVEPNVLQSNDRNGSISSSASSVASMSPMKSSFASVPFNQNIMPASLGAWQWDPTPVPTTNHGPSSYWMHSTSPFPQASNVSIHQSVGGLSGTEAFPSFTSSLASEALHALDYNMSHQQTHEQHIVPRLLSNITTDESIFDDGEMTDDADSPDETCSSFDNATGAHPFAVDLCSSAAAPLRKAPRILASQSSPQISTSELSPRSLFPTAQAAQRNSLQSPEHRTRRDDHLLQLRAKGLSYKEIKRRGGFTEAESTLRGRIRILSRPKHERVRKPQWSQKDIALLDRAIRACTGHSEAVHASSTTSPLASLDPSGWTSTGGHPNNDTNMPKPPWKKVAQWMQENGSSYPFAAATCAKKWDEVRSSL